jgi:hypothetical protein
VPVVLEALAGLRGFAGGLGNPVTRTSMMGGTGADGLPANA